MKKFYFLIVLITGFILSSLHMYAQPVAMPDSAITRSGLPILIPVMQNDYDPDGDSIYVTSYIYPKHGVLNFMTRKILYTPNNNFIGIDTFRYKLVEHPGGFYSYAYVYVTVSPGKNFDSIQASNINAAMNSDGTMSFDYVSDSYFEVPKGSGKSTVFMHSLLITGKDPLDSIHYSGGEYEQREHFFPGPVSNVYDSAYRDKFYRTWKVTKAEVEYHKTHWWTWGYVAPEAMQNWPAHGNTSLGQAANLAPFYDFDNDGIYEPNHGDYPIIRGDEALLFVFSDGQSMKNTSQGKKLNVDVIGMMYAFNCPDDSALWNSLFVNYKIFNRSSVSYHNLYMGYKSDMDIGFSDDDYIGCDVQRSTYYTYNGKTRDGNGQPQFYGMNPPVQGVVMLKGPLMDADGIDNPIGIDYGINGYGFGDGIDDNECLGLSKFMFSVKSGGSGLWMSDPGASRDYYYFLRTDTLFVDHGVSPLPDTIGCGPVTRFLFPDNTDPLHWGTNYQTPNCYPDNWTEDTIHNTPFDKRCFASYGPVNLLPGMEKEMDIAFVFARNFNDTLNRAAIPIMQQRVDSLRKYFVNDYTPCSGSFFNTPKQEEINSEFHVFPNPATNQLIFEITNAENNSVVTITDLYGNKIMSNNLNNKMSGSFDISGLSRGMYLINIVSGNKSISKKFIKL